MQRRVRRDSFFPAQMQLTITVAVAARNGEIRMPQRLLAASRALARHLLPGLGALAITLTALSVPAYGVPLYESSFDTPTTSLAETLSVYGLTNSGIPDAIASGGVLELSPLGGAGSNRSLDVGAFAGDLVITLGVTTSGVTADSINVGLRIGDNNLIFHPGFVAGQGAFRIDGPGGHGNTLMGFVPDRSVFSTMEVTIDGTTGSIEIRIVDGSNPGLVYLETFQDLDYVSGVTPIGLTTGSSSATGGALFDFVTVVPEPGTAFLLGGGLLGLAARGRRRKA